MSQTPISTQLMEAVAEFERALNGKEFFVSAVLDRVREATNHYPHDGAIRTLQFVLEKKANREGSLSLISQSQLTELYTQLGGLGNREVFADSLGDLLLAAEQPKVASYNESLMAGMRDGGEPLSLSDPNASEALYGLFSDQPLEAARGSFVDNGRKGIAIELEAMGFANPDVEVAARNNDFVVYAASIESTHGRVGTYIPAEVKLGSVLMPSVFVSGDEFVELTQENLRAHAQAVAMGKRSVGPAAILSTLTRLAQKQEELQKVADFEGEISLSVPELYSDTVEVEAFVVEQPKVAMPKELEHLTEGQIRDVLAEAGLSYDRDTVNAVKLTVATELRTAGIQFNKVAIGSEFAGGLNVVANIVGKGGQKTIEIPVEIVNNRVLAPTVFTAGALAQPFDRDSLVAFASDEGAGKFDPIMSNKYGMNFKQLHNLMLRSAAYGNFVEVEEALAVIAEQFGDDLHKAAHDDLLGLLAVAHATEEGPIDAMESYVKQASERAKDKENYIHVQSTAAMLYPEA